MGDDTDRIEQGGRHVLVVEDDYFIAEDLAAAVAAGGDSVLGPVANVADALAARRWTSLSPMPGRHPARSSHA